MHLPQLRDVAPFATPGTGGQRDQGWIRAESGGRRGAFPSSALWPVG
ncbi:SH3 domain-containing protein [Azospirillum canadense]